MKHFTLILFAFLLLLSCANHIFIFCLLTPATNATTTTSSEPSSTLINNLNSTRTSTIKTSRNNYGRTIQRTVGGFLGVSSNDVARSESRQSAAVVATTTTTTTTPRPSPIYYSRTSNSRDSKVYFKPRQVGGSKSNIDTSIKSSSSNINLAISKELGKNDEENTLDYGLMSMSATGDGKNKSTDEDGLSGSNGNKKDESKKTLSDQIAEGKYALIDKELFSKKPKPLGIISYLTNPETPNDNSKTLGGLDKDDIWLAEDHLLILKGGSFNKKNSYDDEDWKPIDDYEAPKRPVKIPNNPKIPPPFPVQLEENGPVQIIGGHQFSLGNPFGPNDPNTKNPTQAPTPTNGFDKTNFIAGPPANGSKTNGYLYPPPYPPSAFPQLSDVIPPWLFNQTGGSKPNIPLPFPFPPPLPPNIEQLLRAGNGTEDFDEDDPSLFYPPPYSFNYKSNYTNLVPPGPLVPGIILPPPPDFFQQDEESGKEKKIKTPLDVLHRINEIQLRKKLATTSTTESTPTTTYRPPYRPIIAKTRKPTAPPTTKLSKIKQTTTYSSITPTYVYPTTTIPPRTSTYGYYDPTDKNRRPSKPDTTTIRLRPIYTTTAAPSTTTPVPTTKTTSRPIVVKEFSPNEIIAHTPKTVLTKVPFVDQPEIISFVPKVNKNNQIYTNEFSNNNGHHSVYYEYFDARAPNPPENQYIPQPVYPVYKSSFKASPSPSTTTVKPLYKETVVKPNKKTKDFYPSTQFVSSSPAPIVSSYEPFDYNKYLYTVTPKPEIIPNGIPSSSFPTSTDLPIHEEFVPIIHNKSPHKVVLKPLKAFDDEIDSIRQTLNYYKQHQQQKYHYSPEIAPQRAPKAKTVYEYAFDATKTSNQGFQTAVQYDDSPFQPMLSYAQLAAGDTAYYTDNTGRSKKVKNSYLATESPPLSQNYFATQKVPIEQIVTFAKTNPNRDYYDPAVLSDLFTYNNNGNQQQQNYYQTSTETTQQNYYKTSQSQSAPQTVKNSNKATTSNVFGQKIRNNPQSQQQSQKHQQQPQASNQQLQPQAQPWVSVEKQVIKELSNSQYRQPQNVNLQVPHRGFQGQSNYRVNNRHMNFRKNQRPQKIVSQYNDEAEYLKQYHYDSEVPSLLNDTLVNYLNNQRPINPYSEFIDITNVHPIVPQVQHSPPNYNNYNNRYPVVFPGHYQRLPLQQAPHHQQHPHHQQQQQQQQYAPLEKDIVVNYKYPLPQINPESVSITSPSMVFNRPHNTFKRKADQEPQQQQQQQPQAQQSQRKSSRVYYISPPNEQQQKKQK